MVRIAAIVFTSECLEKAEPAKYLTRHYTSLISFREPPRHLIIPSFAISQETATAEAELVLDEKHKKKLRSRARRSGAESRNRRPRGGVF